MNWYDLSKVAMPAPTPAQGARFYYHGTSKEAAGELILQQGIRPPTPREKQNFLTPVAGKVYLTPEPRYAMIYALGGDVAGSSDATWLIERSGSRYGYVFQVRGSDMVDVQPDEDSVGELLYSGKAPPWLTGMAQQYVAPSRLKQVKGGYYAYFAAVGKQLLRRMSDWQKTDLMKMDVHVAHTGNIIPVAAWKIDKTLAPRLLRDGSNFFELAEKVR